ncbi:MAG: thiamine phosphate synthase [Chloroflexi bacterium]|nr:thiamine phosphate synthase [Chloroflexota bacterium]
MIIEDIRLLESFVTVPLGLYSDIKMLRESLPFPEAAELSREETIERRTAFMTLTDAPLELALETMSSISNSIDILEHVKGDPPLEPDWVVRARRVLIRAEQKVGGDIRASIASKINGLYVIVDPEATNGRPVIEVAEATLKGGASVLQLRDKTQDKGDILPIARQLKAMCDEHGALFIMNDDADIALACDAHGLHVGQTDLPVSEARRALGHRQIIGTSNGGVDESMQSQSDGADYLAVGAVFATTTMGKSGRTSLGVEMLRKVKELTSQPIVAIGGINLGNIADVVKTGADSVCVVSAVTFADDPEAATRELVEAIQSAR